MAVSFKAGAIAAALCGVLVAPASRAQLASHQSGINNQVAHRGIYLGLAGNAGLQFSSGLDARFDYGGEVRVGYSFNRGLQLYLAGDYNTAGGYTGNPSGQYPITSQQLILITAHLHHFIFQEPSGLGVYYDVGIGVGMASPGYGPTGATAIGLGYAGGLGVEIPITAEISLAPELFYRSVNNATSDNGVTGSIQAIGLQLGVLYY